VDKQPDGAPKLEPERLVKQQLEGVATGVKEFREALAKSTKQTQPAFR
jgi:hypothetical protein